MALRKHFAAAEFDRRPLPAVVFHGGLRVADRDGPAVGQRPVEHRRKVVLVAGREHRHVGEQSQVAEIEGAVVRGAIRARQPGPVEHKHNRQVLEADLLEDLVERPLEERAVDVDDRPAAGLGLPCREGHGMRLADPHVEEPLRKLLANGFKLVALAHRGRHHRHAGIPPQGGPDRR